MPAEIRASIKAGKNVNMAALLIAADNGENQAAAQRTIEVLGQAINLKPFTLRDSRLTCMLTVNDFARAVGPSSPMEGLHNPQPMSAILNYGQITL